MADGAKLWRGAAVATLAVLVAAGCQGGGDQPKKDADKTGGTKQTADVDPSMVVPGFQLGEVPPVPLFELPDLSLLQAHDDAFTVKFDEIDNSYPGLTVSPAACDEYGSHTTSNGALLAYGDGTTSYTGADGETWNYGDGSGSYESDGVTFTNYGDGSGSYESGDLSVWNYADGSGSYTSADLKVWLYGDGTGSYDKGPLSIWNYGDGSASYEDEGVTIWNYGDGSGSYDSPTLSIRNDGQGTATVKGPAGTVEVKADPLPKVPALGKFPPLAALAPQQYCGVSITLDAGLLFDFGKSDVRADAAQVIASVAAVLKDNTVPAATVEGHTDSISDDAFNQTLSENRAKAVTDALRAAGVSTDLTAVGYGKTRPVAPNTNPDGSDNPAGRQLNRRVEIYIPAF